MGFIGYARVSTNDQDAALQHDKLAASGVERTFTDHGVSGSVKGVERPELRKALDYLRKGDTLAVYSLSRLGRNTRDVLQIIEELTDNGVGFKSLTEQIDTSGPMGRAMLTIMSAFAQLERETLIERTRAGLEAARARGHEGGRPQKLTDAKVKRLKKLYAERGATVSELGEVFGISRASVYRYVKA